MKVFIFYVVEVIRSLYTFIYNYKIRKKIVLYNDQLLSHFLLIITVII